MAYSDLDDVDYLVEDNTMDDFCLSPEMYGTHGWTTFEDDPDQRLPRRVVHGRMAQWRCKLGTECKCWE